jgi:hypothetical protein
MPAVNPVTEARGYAAKLGNAVGALAQAVSLPIAQPHRDVLQSMITTLQNIATSVQDQAATNPQLTDVGPPQFLTPGAPGHVNPAINPAAVAPLPGPPPGPGPGMGPIDPAVLAAMMGQPPGGPNG